MKPCHFFSAFVALTMTTPSMVAADSSYTQQDGILAFPLKASVGEAFFDEKAKRQSDTVIDSRLSGTLYTIDIAIGTPGQTVTVQFDTGSAETWVNPDCTFADNPAFCADLGQFQYTESSSFENLGTEGGVDYVTGSVSFVYGEDVLAIGDATIEGQRFGVGYDSRQVSAGIFGAGPDIRSFDSPYPMVIDNLATQGLISSRAFSLDLRSIDSDRGSVIFGGLDTSKYSGNLEKLPVVPASASPYGGTRWWVDVGGLTVTREGEDDVIIYEGSQVFFLDSGFTLSGFPTPIFNALLAAFPDAEPVPGTDLHALDCALTEVEGTLDFTFGNTVINVPYRDFVWQQPQNGACLLGAFVTDDLPVLGDTFLRAAYVVFDWDNREIHIANNEDCGTSIEPIGSGPDAVPSIEGGCSPTTTTTSSRPTSTTSKPSTSTTTSTEDDTTATSDDDGPSPTDTEATNTASHPETTSSEDDGTVTAPPTVTATATSIHTITSCPPEVPDCPLDETTSEVIPGPEHTDHETDTAPPPPPPETEPTTAAQPPPAETDIPTGPPPPPPPPPPPSSSLSTVPVIPAPPPPADESSDGPLPTPTTIPESGAALITIPGLLTVAVAGVVAMLL
jgi:hypothetical protein